MAIIKYRPAIDGLRTVAVLSVFLFHLHRKWMPGGFVGVDVFFVVSGFLITSIIHGECVEGRFSLARFYQRRISRIFPAFFVVALFTFVAALFVYLARDIARCGANLAAATLSVANLGLIRQGNYFETQPDSQPFVHYWSLSVEEQFYMIFPVSIMLLHRFARRSLVPVLALVLAASFVAGVVLTRTHPVWAFYLLPTRGWELLAGALLAVVATSNQPRHARLWDALAIAGLAMVVASFFVIHEGPAFPGWIAMLPVLGIVLVIGPNSGSGGIVERFLALPLMTFIGRISYSLYLWHWPVFSFVDYGWYEAPAWQRLGAKLVLSFAAAIACYVFIEKPARQYLNQHKVRKLAFAALPVVVTIFAVVGLHAHRTYFVSSSAAAAADGGVVIGAERTAGSIALVGDSNGSMYGTGLRQIADELCYKLVVLSIPAASPLPRSDGKQNQLWNDILAEVKKNKPTAVVLVCDWQMRLHGSEQPLRLAIRALGPYTQKIILITKPPVLPPRATREAIRNGSRPPFLEDAGVHGRRQRLNQLIKRLASDKVAVLDVEPLFELPDGSVRWKDNRGRLLYFDCRHLSPYGVELVLPDLRRVIRMSDRSATTQTSESGRASREMAEIVSD